MKKGAKITLIVILVVLVVGILIADNVVSSIATQSANKALATMPGSEASVGAIHVRLFSGTAAVEDIHYRHMGEAAKGSKADPGVEVHIDRIELGHVFWTKLMKKELLVHSLHIVRPQMELWMDEEHPELSFPVFENDTTAQNKIAEYFSFALMKFEIEDASLALHSVRTQLDIQAEGCSLTVRGLAYDSTFHYCDSVYDFSLASASVMLPDGSMRLSTQDIAHSDAGPLSIGKTLVAHTMGKKELGERLQEPTTWMSMEMESLKTSPLNPIRKVLAQDYTLEHADVVFGHMDIVRDLRFPPKEPFPMVQEALMALKTVFLVKQVDVQIPLIDVGLLSTNINCGQLQLKRIHATAKNITNRRGQTMHIKGGCPIEKGKMQMEMHFTANSNCDLETRLHAENVNVSYLNTLIRPLVGMTCELQVDTFDTHYRGNKTEATGQFRMLYHGLDVKVHKEDDIPYKIVTRNAGFINSAAHTLLPKSNPSSPAATPRAYNVKWERDVWKPTELYLFGPCINGVMKTMLPGLFIKDKTKVLDL